ncbi:hypothetical protein A9Q89_13145 [Gammaproteobacteria bacterium 53_120_T64]|nr:hypothetical protein A9Q89_13145 [Gammaproteobacteria bacterium 53_120_T64]
MAKFSVLSTQGFASGDIARVELNLATLLAAEANIAHANAGLIAVRQTLNRFLANADGTPLPQLNSQPPRLATRPMPQPL